MDSLERPLPDPTPTSAPFWAALQHGELVMQHCRACTSWVHYPRRRCPRCGSADLAWQPTPAEGTLHTFTITRRPTAAMFAGDVPQIIAIVELSNGVRMTTTLVGDADRPLRIGMPVIGVFDRISADCTLLRFRVA